MQYQYRDRRAKKRTWRELWIQRVSAGARLEGVKYSHLIHGLDQQNVQLNRKVREPPAPGTCHGTGGPLHARPESR